MTILSAAVMLFLIIDPIGNTPALLALLSKVERKRWNRIILRENLIALIVLVAFLLGGRWVLQMFDIRGPELGIAGGVVIFLIALRMIFPMRGGIFGHEHDENSGEPFIVPLAIPLLAGPSAIAVVMLMTTNPAGALTLAGSLLAVFLAWAGSLLIQFLAPHVARVLGQRGLIATERLMGMILVVIAVHLILTSLEQYFALINTAGWDWKSVLVWTNYGVSDSRLEISRSLACL